MNEKYIKTIYKLWAKVYDSMLNKLFYFDRKKVINKLKIKKNDKILEIGVGTGLNLPHYPKNCFVYGIDFSEEMLEKAKQKNTKARVVLKEMDASNLEFKNGFFDKAVTTYVLRVSPNPYGVVNEVSRVVKNNGIFVILDQFKEGNEFLLKLFQPFKLLLGWGKEYHINELIRNTFWKIIKQENIGKMKGTRIIVLENRKQ